MRTARVASALTLALALVALFAVPVGATPRVTLNMRFKPDRPDQGTTIHWAFTISEPTPLRSLELRLPPGMGFVTSSLGLETCDAALLAERGPEGCPVDSRLGYGAAVAQVRAKTTVEEPTKVTVLMGPPTEEGDMTVLFFVEGRTPVNREVVLDSVLSEIASPQGAALLTSVPPLPAWPAGPNIGLIRFHSTIGPEGLTYYRHVNGRTIAFHPRGVAVPHHCPRRGFPVSARFTWWTAEPPATATARVPCPRKGG